MAELVQQKLDDMVVPLRDLLDRNIFTHTEIQSIVSKRRDFEYLIRRRQVRKADFLRYIEYENQLERLRFLRTKKLKQDKKYKQQRRHDKERSTSQHDNHFLMHLHGLYQRLLQKFKSDLSLHLQYAEFCKTYHFYNKLSKVYAQALQIFPRQAGLWIEAASVEFFGARKSIRNARILLQRGIRLLKSSAPELWLEYFALELHYAQTMRGRRLILGLQQKQDTNDNNFENDAGEDYDDDDIYQIPRIIYKNAILGIPDSIAFRLKFMDVCKRFPDTQPLLQYIMLSIEQQTSSQVKDPEAAWIARAMYAAEHEDTRESSREGESDSDDSATGKKGNIKTISQQTTMEKAAKIAQDDQSDNNDNDNDEKGQNILAQDDDDDDIIKFVSDIHSDSINQDNKQRPSKRQKQTGPISMQSFSSSSSNVLSILQNAIETTPTSDMYLQTLRFLLVYPNPKVPEFIDKILAPKLINGDNDTFISSLSSDLILEYAHYLQQQNKTKDNNNNCTTLDFLQTMSTRTILSPQVYMYWANLVETSSSLSSPRLVFKNALQQWSKNTKNNNNNNNTSQDYLTLLLQYFGTLLQDLEYNDSQVAVTFEEILLLAPAIQSNSDFVVIDILNRNNYGITSTAHACWKYLVKICNAQDQNQTIIIMIRKIYTAVLFTSTMDWVHNDQIEYIQQFIDTCIRLEAKNNDKKRLRRLYDRAIELFQDTDMEDEYRVGREEHVVYA